MLPFLIGSPVSQCYQCKDDYCVPVSHALLGDIATKFYLSRSDNRVAVLPDTLYTIFSDFKVQVMTSKVLLNT